EPRAEAVGREHRHPGVERVELSCRHRAALDDLDARGGRPGGEPAYPADRMQRPVAGVDKPAGVAPREAGRHRVEPLDRVAVLAERLALPLEPVALRGVGREAEAADADEDVAGELLEPV